jgi:succinyl-CoA synthetase alpha subunit
MAEALSISTSGPTAFKEAMEALKAGKHVVLLGNGISFAEELELKRFAAWNGLLLLGPRCATSILSGEGFGIWNSVRRGPIGIIGTFGSGIQHVACLLNRVGVSHALDVGFRDLSQSVGAYGTVSALRFLKEDARTEVLVLLSREPATNVKRLVLDEVEKTKKPAVICFLGGGAPKTAGVNFLHVKNLEEAAVQAVVLSGRKKVDAVSTPSLEKIRKIAEAEYERFGYGQKYVRGLYSGGALCTEGLTLISELLPTVYSNIPLKPRLRMPDLHSSRGHVCMDFGAYELSGGSHPAVNLVQRCGRILKEAKDWEAAVVLMDIILGNGAHPNPAAEIARAVKEAKKTADQMGGYLSVVASITGTQKDPQNLKHQRGQLKKAGVILMPSNAQAARVASLIATRGKVLKKLRRKD